MQKQISKLKQKYEEVLVRQLGQEFGIENRMAIPKIEKIVVSMGVGEMIKNKEIRTSLSRDLAAITGQFPTIRLARVSIAGFNLRRGMPVGLAVTIRGLRMYNFMEKLFSIVLPRLRDFRGVSLSSFDKSGNYTLGIVEHSVFPEVDVTKSGGPHGLEVTIVTNNKDPQKAKRLLELLGMPFEKEEIKDNIKSNESIKQLER